MQDCPATLTLNQAPVKLLLQVGVGNVLLIALIMLQIAQGHISALEQLIDAYAMIGEAMPRFDRLSEAFKGDPEFRQVMGHFYEDILEFHRRAYMFFRRRGESSI